MATHRAPTFSLEETTTARIQRALRSKQISARELVDAYINRIKTLDQRGPRLNSIVRVNQTAPAQALALDRHFARTGKLQGPLHGIPILLKDNIDTADVPTTYGSAAFANYQPRQDATVVSKLRAAGAIILGKTTMPDFATSWWAYSSMSGETKNPYDLSRDPGGSSAGTGAAIAANLAALGLGTDCGGSIRLPSSCNNLIGIRSTPGVISRAGASTLVFFQDTIGPMARTVRDAVIVFDVMTGYDPLDSLSVHAEIGTGSRFASALDANGLKRARLGLITNALGSSSNPYATPVNNVIRSAVTRMQRAGAIVLDIEIPDLPHHITATSMYINCTKRDINAFLAARPTAPLRTLNQIYETKKYHPMLDLIDACVTGPELPEYDPQYFRRLAAREEFQRVLMNVMSKHALDALIFPDVQVVPPTREQLNTQVWTTLTFPTNTLIASQSWLPAISVPAGFTEDGLPVGLEIMTRPYAEATMFKLAFAFEQYEPQRRAPKLGA